MWKTIWNTKKKNRAKHWWTPEIERNYTPTWYRSLRTPVFFYFLLFFCFPIERNHTSTWYRSLRTPVLCICIHTQTHTHTHTHINTDMKFNKNKPKKKQKNASNKNEYCTATGSVTGLLYETNRHEIKKKKLNIKNKCAATKSVPTKSEQNI